MKRLTLMETAASLDLPVDTLERWIRQGRIPILRDGSYCVFKLDKLTRWARQHHMPFRISEGGGGCEKGSGCESLLAEAFHRGGFVIGLKEEDREGLLGRMISVLPDLPETVAPRLMERLLEREALGSTGVGRGIALPHPRIPLENYPESARILVAFPEKPVDYGAIDGQLVFVFFLLLAPDVKTHLSLLSRLSCCLRTPEFYALLARRPGREDLMKALTIYDQGLLKRGEIRS
ncbi:PTS sugar transporter subunit IIA [Desulfobotulus sp. H1]|uniref:PTS sugar transporter subunit IIA n=1 Tax=Desulfobotulus pelophilus TaxID=2823377 RepID=A0ABT3N6D5_9BACT|nr:PTS sugar transporter subunit IIA [Desulfobotulus pelophilus]MCW7752716.1 PTS sugar transporter subunit IIA [Desulfobotulus pelophilus]